jgi:hypothetical protein
MFAPAYFGKRYFAQRYFCRGASGTVNTPVDLNIGVPVVVDVKSAIAQLVESDTLKVYAQQQILIDKVLACYVKINVALSKLVTWHTSILVENIVTIFTPRNVINQLQSAVKITVNISRGKATEIAIGVINTTVKILNILKQLDIKTELSVGLHKAMILYKAVKVTLIAIFTGGALAVFIAISVTVAAAIYKNLARLLNVAVNVISRFVRRIHPPREWEDREVEDGNGWEAEQGKTTTWNARTAISDSWSQRILKKLGWIPRNKKESDWK